MKVNNLQKQPGFFYNISSKIRRGVQQQYVYKACTSDRLFIAIDSY